MEDFRKHYDALNHYTYLDTASCGLVSSDVTSWRRQYDNKLNGSVSSLGGNMKVHIHRIRQTVADFFGAQTQEVGFVTNFSYGMNMVLEGIPKRQKVLLLTDEYPSVTWPVKHRDFEVFYAKIDENLEQNIEDAIVKHKPDIFIFSIVQWLTGIKIDLEFVKRLKKDHPNILLIADGTQYLGTESFDFEASGIDVLGTSCYKWLTSGFGTGFFIVRESARERIKLRVIGFFSAETFESNREDTAYMSHFEPGHLDILGFGSLEQSLLLIQSLGEGKIYDHIKYLSNKAKSRFEEKDLLLDHTRLREKHSPIFNLKGDDALFEKLMENNIVCALRGGGIRVGFHYYNNESDLQFLMEVLG